MSQMLFMYRVTDNQETMISHLHVRHILLPYFEHHKQFCVLFWWQKSKQGIVVPTSARFQPVWFSLVQNVYDMNPHT